MTRFDAKGAARGSKPARRNLGATTIRRKARKGCAMQDYDQLPAELRAWLASAALPWGPKSVRRVFDRAMARTQDKTRAIAELNRLQDRMIANDARKIWGETHPHATGLPHNGAARS